MIGREPAAGPRGDEFATSAGAYVLGALSATERAAFEAHLRTCPACALEVAEVAGLPGLLARVPLDVVESLDEPVPPQPDLLPGLLRTVRARRRRFRLVAGGALGLAAASALVLTLVLSGVVGPDHGNGNGTAPAAAGPVPSVTMTPVIPELPITAEVGLTGVAWGTRIHMRCLYGEKPGTAAADVPRTYVLVVIDAAGQSQQVASWNSIPGHAADVSGSSSWKRADIRWLEVRTPAGTPILRVTV